MIQTRHTGKTHPDTVYGADKGGTKKTGLTGCTPNFLNSLVQIASKSSFASCARTFTARLRGGGFWPAICLCR